MPDVEFVNREVAEAEAARAIGLLNASDESKVEAWFALQAVADQVGPASNVGVRGISWESAGRRSPRYRLNGVCRAGVLGATTGAPSTLEEARAPENLDPVIALLGRKVEEMGGWTRPHLRSASAADALVESVAASETGRAWLAARSTSRVLLLRAVNVADAYGREGVNPHASLGAHAAFIPFGDRNALVREFPEYTRATAKAMSMRADKSDVLDGPAALSVPRSKVADLAIRSGVSRAEARTILRALMDGRSKTRLVRAINEGIRMVEAMENATESKAA